MKKYLSKKDYLEIGERLELGQKTRVNHNTLDCSGDSKSLLIERKENGDISAKCFRCSCNGYYSSKTTPKSKSFGELPKRDKPVATGQHTLPGDYSKAIEEWPSAARVWIRRYGITDEEALNYGICYSNDIGRVLLPVWDTSGLCFYQSRKIFPEDTAPKYLSYRNRDYPFVCSSGTGHSIAIVEDYLSGIKCGRIMPTLVLFGTTLHSYHIKYLIERGYTDFKIFLDDDNNQVKKNALKNKKILDRIGTCTVIHSDGKDPKEYSDEELKEILL